jgi:hypothetical protein
LSGPTHRKLNDGRSLWELAVQVFEDEDEGE